MTGDTAKAIGFRVEIVGGCIMRLTGNRSVSGLVGVREVDRDEESHHTQHNRSKDAQSDMRSDNHHRIPFAL